MQAGPGEAGGSGGKATQSPTTERCAFLWAERRGPSGADSAPPRFRTESPPLPSSSGNRVGIQSFCSQAIFG
jgi:hypothetical protein